MTQFFTSFSVGCILIGSLYIICPEGNISKSVKYIFSLVFLIIIITAANIPFKKISFDLPTNNSSQMETNNIQISAAEYIYSFTLKKENINFKRIYVCTDNSESESIVITKVVIVSNEEDSKIIKALGELAKTRKVEIINE